MIPTTSRRRVKFKTRTPRSTRGNGRRIQRVLVAALLAVGLGAPVSLLIRAAVQDRLAKPDGTARRFPIIAPATEPLLRPPAAAPVAVAAPVRNDAARPAMGWSTPAPDAPVSRPWETPFVNGRNVAVAPVVPVPVPAVRTALNARDAGFAPVVPTFDAPVRGATAPAAPVGLQGLTAPALASLVASATQTTAAPAAGIESAPAARLAPTSGAVLNLGLHPHVSTNPATFTWSGGAAVASTPDPNWTTNLNWVNGTAPGATAGTSNISYTPTPAGATATNVNQDYAINSLTFQGPVAGASPGLDTPSYNVTGNLTGGGVSDLSVGAGGITDGSANAQTLSLPVYATANQTFLVSNAAGRLNLPGATADPSQAPVALYLQGQNRTVTVDGPGTTAITGQVREGNAVVNGALVKNGAGTFILAGNNAYSGGVTVNAGVLDLQSNTALGTGPLVINGGILASTAPNSSFILPNAITVNADFAHATSDSGLTLTGPVALGTTSRTISSITPGFSAFLTFNGAISASGPGVGLSFVHGPGPNSDGFILGGGDANTYTGTTLVDNVRLVLAKTGGAVAVPGDLTVRNSGSVDSTGVQLAPTANLTLNAFGDIQIGAPQATPTSQTLASLNGDSRGSVGLVGPSALVTLNVGRGDFAGTISDRNSSFTAPATFPFAATGGALNKTSAGTLTLSGNNFYTGGTLVTAGTLLANNNPDLAAISGGFSATGTGNVLVLDGARLGGSGSIGGAASTVTIGGTLPTASALPEAVPTFTPAILGAGATGAGTTAILLVNANLTLTNTALLETELGGTTAGTGYDQVRVGGAITLDGNLSLATVNGFALTKGQTFYILDGISADAVITGTFANVANGVYTDAAGNRFTVNYADTDPNDPSGTAGNDLSVTYAPANVPEPGSLALLAAGAGAGLAAWVRRRRTV